MKTVLEILKYIWQLPQNLLGLILISFSKSKEVEEVQCNDEEIVKVYLVNDTFGGIVSLGKYILCDTSYFWMCSKGYRKNIISHEHGHQKQSMMLGWLYLLIVGFTSLFLVNIPYRIFKKSNDWYYSRFPENWANKLGKVDEGRL